MRIHHTPIWLDRFPSSRRPSYPAFRGQLDADVVIVGGGLTGCACAAAFAAAGVKTALIEAGRIGAGSTAGSLGLIRQDFDASFQATCDAHGLRAARALWHGCRRASLDAAATIRRLGIRCDLTPQDLLRVSARDGEEVRRFRREYQARRNAGLEHSWVTSAALIREAHVAAGGAIRTRGFTIDPYRASVGLAAAATSRAAAIFERSVVRRIRASRKRVEVAVGTGSLRAQAVLIATGAPLPDLKALRRHLRPEHGYAVVTGPLPAAVRRELGGRATALRDGSVPPHFLRWLKDDRAFFMGADQPPVAPRARAKVLLQRTGQLMYELSVIYPAISGAQAEWSWDVTHESTVDGLPFIGLHRNFPRHLFALGHGRHGAAVPWLAARVLLRQFQGQPDKKDELFGFSRVLA